MQVLDGMEAHDVYEQSSSRYGAGGVALSHQRFSSVKPNQQDQAGINFDAENTRLVPPGQGKESADSKPGNRHTAGQQQLISFRPGGFTLNREPTIARRLQVRHRACA